MNFYLKKVALIILMVIYGLAVILMSRNKYWWINDFKWFNSYLKDSES